jgi:hypothetical protein
MAVPAQPVRDQLVQWFPVTPYQISLAFVRSAHGVFVLGLRVPLNKCVWNETIEHDYIQLHLVCLSYPTTNAKDESSF